MENMDRLPQQSPPKAVQSSKGDWLNLTSAGRLLGVSRKTLWRFWKAGYLRLARGKYTGRLYAHKDRLLVLPVYPLGRAARLIGVHYETLRLWAKRKKVMVWNLRFTKYGKGWRRVSIREILRLSEKVKRKRRM